MEADSAQNRKEVNLLMVGVADNGKSSTRDTILGTYPILQAEETATSWSSPCCMINVTDYPVLHDEEIATSRSSSCCFLSCCMRMLCILKGILCSLCCFFYSCCKRMWHCLFPCCERKTQLSKVIYTTESVHIRDVVELPNLVTAQDSLQVAEESLRRAFDCYEDGFHAVLLVLKYGKRFTEDESNYVRELKSMLGPDFTKNHCILVFTHGDLFDLQPRNKRINAFKRWLEEQTGDLANLIRECENRAILFDNLTPGKRNEIMTELMSLIQTFQTPYTRERFVQVKG